MNARSLALCVFFSLLAACGDDGDKKPTLASVTVKVVEEGSGDVIAGARVLLVEADTGAPAGPALVTDRAGNAKAEVDPGALYLRVDAAGHHPRPLPGGPSVPVEFVAGSNPVRVVELIEREGPGGRTLTGEVLHGQGPLGAVLVVAEGPGVRTTFTDAEGGFVLFDLSPGDYTLRALLAGYSGPSVAASVAADANPEPVELQLESGNTGAVAGQVTFLAVQNGAVRVTLQDEASGEAVPGLSAPVTDGSYRVEGVPPGTYIAWAALENELPVGYVMDPDAILKFGLPIVTVPAGGEVEQDFDVTGAVKLLSPASDELIGTVPVTATPTFEWEPYSSADRYFLEVADELGRVVWGGFDGETPKVEVPKETTTVVYGEVAGTDQLPLAPGRVYRVRVWAGKADSQDPRGFRIISVTEDQRGLFEVHE